MGRVVSALGASATAGAELRKLPAFVRRDLLIAWSYRMPFVTDWLALGGQVLLFSFLGRLVEPSRLPAFGGRHSTYMEFAVVGIALGAFFQVSLGQIAAAIRQEQLAGTLEPLLLTPTSTATVQLGAVAYQLVYVPIRTVIFLIVTAAAFGLRFHLAGLGPSLLILAAFIPFVWGLGVAAAAGMLTFRRGSGPLGLGAVAMTLFSGAYFPLHLLPHWALTISRANPLALALDGTRQALLGGSGWGPALVDAAKLLPLSVVSLLLGALAFRWALARERARGTLWLY